MQNESVPVLGLHQSVDREMNPGETHSYLIHLEANQFCRVTVEQKGIDVEVQVYRPDQQLVAKVNDPGGALAPENIYWITDTAGTYRLEIVSDREMGLPGRYQVLIQDIHPATELNRVQVNAQKAFDTAQMFHEKKTAESFKKAIESYQETIRWARQAQDQRLEVTALNGMGQAFHSLNDFPQALSAYQQVLPLRRLLQDPSGEVATLINIGAVYNLQAIPQTALGYLNQALGLAQEHNLRQRQGQILMNMGTSYNLLGKNQRAVELYRQALDFHREFHNRSSEASTLDSLGVAYKALGEFQSAVECYQQALTLAQALNDKRKQAATLNNLGMVYSSLNDFRKALEYLSRALPLMAETGNRVGEAVVLANLGIAYFGLNDSQQALRHLHRGLAILEAVGSQNRQGLPLLSLGRVYHDLGKLDLAQEYFEKALQSVRQAGDQVKEATVLSNLGFLYQALNKSEQAEEYFQSALVLQQTLGNVGAEAVARFDLAQFRRAQGNLPEALALMEMGLRQVERFQVNLEQQDLRVSYFGSTQCRFDAFIQLLMELHRQNPNLGYDRRALQVSEQGRARLLLEKLQVAHTKIHRWAAPELLEQEQVLQQEFNAKTEALTRLNSQKHTPEQKQNLERKIASLQTELQQLEVRIQKESPHYAALKYPKMYTLAEIQQKALDADTILLEYALGNKESYLWVVTPTGMSSHVLPGRAKIEEAALRVYQLITAREQRPFESNPEVATRSRQADIEFPRAAAELSQMLLGPVAGQLGGKRLLIVGDGVLQYLPFAALPEPSGSGGRVQSSGQVPQKSKAGLPPKTPKVDSALNSQLSALNPLVVTHEIVMLPSASTLLVQREAPEQRLQGAQSIAIFANPVFSATDKRVQGRLEGTDTASTPSDVGLGSDRSLDWAANLDSVPETESIARDILALAPVGEKKLAVGFDANLQTATAPELNQYRIIHFATHGYLNTDPELSGVVLSLVDRMGNPQPGVLTANHVYNLNLAADLVVLSACQTGLALDFKENQDPVKRTQVLQQVKGQGLTGLARGFMYAGAERLAVSLWNIRVKGTRELMNRFYAGMFGPQKLSPAAALRAAQVAMWKESKWNAPYYWAGFVLIGEYR
ncbi:MAG: CHAT domain-containing protein [Blastocatellia bacterium]|nr:CHAT domain-containing protein [Blastocatellia bacterium]